MEQPNFIIDGSKFTTLDEFYDHICEVFCLPLWWGKNLDAFDELFHSDLMPLKGYSIRWIDITISKKRLGYGETIQQLSKRLETCHPDNISIIKNELENATKGLGPTVFDWLVEIISEHSKTINEMENTFIFLIE